MPNLRNRLQLIRMNKTPTAKKPAKREDKSINLAAWPLWSEAGFKVLKRKIIVELTNRLPSRFPGELAILVPDFLRIGRIPQAGELLFFDLETTGLSGGAGTLAFLAAFGRFLGGAKGGVTGRLEITQYLLLDFSGEADFIEKVLKEFDGLAPVLSYNGKCFDSQILKNRCLMNGFKTPENFNVDLLHPSRRLWKRMLPDCSQATIEVSVLGLDRTGDVSGAMAPEIWFSFLRTGENRELLSVCDHNVKDITGLAAIFLGLTEIAGEPLQSREKYNFDEENLAIFWHMAVKKNKAALARICSDNQSFQSCLDNEELLLKNAAANGSSRAAIVLAIKAEWHLNDPALALSYTKAALANPEIPERLHDELERRKLRLEGKIKN